LTRFFPHAFFVLLLLLSFRSLYFSVAILLFP